MVVVVETYGIGESELYPMCWAFIVQLVQHIGHISPFDREPFDNCWHCVAAWRKLAEQRLPQ
jgi:hypothetical protein